MPAPWPITSPTARLRQTYAAPSLLARVDASVRTLGYSATLVGALVSGVLAEQFGARALLFASSALLALAALAAALLLRRPRFRRTRAQLDRARRVVAPGRAFLQLQFA